MRQPLIKRLEAMHPSLEEAEEVVEQLIKHLEAVKPGPGEAQALVERMKHGPPSASDRHRLLEILEAEEAALQFLTSWTPPHLPRQEQPRVKRTTPRGKRAGRRHRR